MSRSSTLGECWNSALDRLRGHHYLDDFLGRLKQTQYLALIQRWTVREGGGRLLKTDLFEESMGPDALLPDLSAQTSLSVGIDLSSSAVATALRQRSPRSFEALIADVRRLPFADHSFSTVLSPSTLDHFEDPQDLGHSLRELHRVLEPGGRLIITLDNRDNILDPVLRLMARLGLLPYFLGRSYDIGELRDELRAAGFEVMDTTAILHNPRLLAVGAVHLAAMVDSWPLTWLVHRVLEHAQALQHTRWRYRTGSFVAALAVRR